MEAGNLPQVYLCQQKSTFLTLTKHGLDLQPRLAQNSWSSCLSLAGTIVMDMCQPGPVFLSRSTRLHLEAGLTDQARLTMEPQGSACFHSPSTEITRVCHHAQLFSVGTGDLNLCPHDFRARTSLTEPFSQVLSLLRLPRTDGGLGDGAE